MLNELIRDIYETSNMDMGNRREGQLYHAPIPGAQAAPRRIRPHQTLHLRLAHLHPPAASGYVGYGEEPPDQARG